MTTLAEPTPKNQPPAVTLRQAEKIVNAWVTAAMTAPVIDEDVLIKRIERIIRRSADDLAKMIVRQDSMILEWLVDLYMENNQQ
jgi:hypothetical protein